MTRAIDIHFRDLVEREEKERHKLETDLAVLKQRKTPTDEEKKNIHRIDAVLKQARTHGELADPLFVAVRDLFNENSGLIGIVLRNHDRGKLEPQPQPHAAAGGAAAAALGFDDVVRVSLVLGLLSIDGANPPRVLHLPNKNKAGVEIGLDPSDPANDQFSKAFFAAFGEAHGAFNLANLVLPILEDEGDPTSSPKKAGNVSTAEFASVIRCLRSKGIGNLEPQLKRRVSECLDTIQSVGVNKPLSDVVIALPDLDSVSNYQIHPENVKLMGPIIFAAMFEELKAFQVVDKLVELGQNGMLPIGRGEAGEMLYRYWKETPNRMSEAERRDLYSFTIGIPGGNADSTANRDFNDLWMRFISSVSSLVRQKTADEILRSKIPAAISQQQVRKAARDIGQNLSSRGYGMTLYRALELQDLVKMVIKLLSDKDILSSYGSRDMWQVIDQVATLELGGARNTSRYRTLAICGAIITAWLAKNVSRYNSSTGRVVIDVDEVLSTDPPTAGPKATEEPRDYDLVNACDLWAIELATSDERIEELSQPRESPVMTSKPVQIPSIAREMLEQAGVPGLGMGMGMGAMRR